MARRRARPQPGPGPTECRFAAAQDPHPWRVTCDGVLFAVIYSNTPREDAERIAAALNDLRDVPTSSLQGRLVTRLAISLRLIADLLRGHPPAEVTDLAAYTQHVLQQANTLLAQVNVPPVPSFDPNVET